MGLFRSSKRDGDSPPSDRSRAASLNRFGFRRHRGDKSEKGDDSGGGAGLSFMRRMSPRNSTSNNQRRQSNESDDAAAPRQQSQGDLTLRSECCSTGLAKSAEDLRLNLKTGEEGSSTPESPPSREVAATEMEPLNKRAGGKKQSVRLAATGPQRCSEDTKFVEKRWRTKSTPLTTKSRDQAALFNDRLPDEAAETTRLAPPTDQTSPTFHPSGSGSGIIKVSNDVATVRPSAVRQAEQKKPSQSNRRVSIITDKKGSELGERDSPRYVPKKNSGDTTILKTSLMQRDCAFRSSDGGDSGALRHGAAGGESKTAMNEQPKSEMMTPKVARRVRQWPPVPAPRPPSPAITVATAPASILHDLDDDEDFGDNGASPAASEGSTVASPVAADIEARKELSQSAAKLGFVRRATMRLGEKEYTSVKSSGSTPQTPKSDGKGELGPNTSMKMASPLAACPGFGDEGSANELLKALAFRREKTLKLEQSWGGQGMGDDLSSGIDDVEDDDEEEQSADNNNTPMPSLKV